MPSSLRPKIALLAVLLAVLSVRAGDTPSTGESQLRTATGVKVDFAELIPLDLYVGPWRVKENHFDARGEVIATVTGDEDISWVLDIRAIRRIYTTSSTSTVFRAIGMLTWNAAEKAYHGVWFDNRSNTGPINMKGEWFPETNTMEFSVESLGEDGSLTTYKVVERFVDSKKRVATTFLTTGGNVVKRMEVEYVRSIPCPNKIRPILEPDIVGITK